MPKIHLTDIALRKLKPPTDGQVTCRDEAVPGFNCRVGQRGDTLFTVVYDAIADASRSVTIRAWVFRKRATPNILPVALAPLLAGIRCGLPPRWAKFKASRSAFPTR